MRTLDLNCDMGEYEDPARLAREAQLMPLITSVNIACGAHAGHPELMLRTARLAVQHGTAIGAHPGFPDTQDFGRRDHQASAKEVESLVFVQLKTLTDVLASVHLRLSHMKLHGALYNLASRDRTVADAVTRALTSFNPHLLLFALSGSELVTSGRTAGLTVIQEAFADRAYQSDGTLVPRTQPNALLQTQQHVREQLCAILTGSVTSVDGEHVPIRADTLCVHMDTPHAGELLQLIRQELASAGVRITKPFRT
ncbi:MAG TPA: 5-oxoprolinase subunit PxpA [Nitrospira sp.]|nr:5-oxoprolinase subunit PxpA [Nitrospira sp.]